MTAVQHWPLQLGTLDYKRLIQKINLCLIWLAFKETTDSLPFVFVHVVNPERIFHIVSLILVFAQSLKSREHQKLLKRFLDLKIRPKEKHASRTPTTSTYFICSFLNFQAHVLFGKTL